MGIFPFCFEQACLNSEQLDSIILLVHNSSEEAEIWMKA